MNLGTKIKQGDKTMLKPQKSPKISYPSFTISDDKVDDFLDESGAELDDVVTATVKLKVTGLRKDQFGKSVSLDVLAIDGIAESEADETDDGDEADTEETDENGDGAKTPKVNKAVKKMMKE